MMKWTEVCINCPPALPSLLVGTKLDKKITPTGMDQMRKGREAKCPKVTHK